MSNTSFGVKLKAAATALKYPRDSDYYRSYIEYYGGSHFQQFEGMNDQEIITIANAQGVERLPEFYIEYLRYFGKRSGDLFIGSDTDSRYLPTLKMSASSLKTKFEPVEYGVPEDAFVFKGHQDNTYWYFRTNNKLEDPPVYMLWEDMNGDDTENDYIRESLPYHDNHGYGWITLSSYLALFIKERAGQDSYDEFLRAL